MKLRIATKATTLMVTGGVGLAAVGLGAGIASATGPPYCPGDPPNWAPGGPPETSFVHWDWSVCHNYHYGPTGVVDEDTGYVWAYPDGPMPPAVETTPYTRPPYCPPWATIFSGPAECGGL